MVKTSGPFAFGSKESAIPLVASSRAMRLRVCPPMLLKKPPAKIFPSACTAIAKTVLFAFGLNPSRGGGEAMGVAVAVTVGVGEAVAVAVAVGVGGKVAVAVAVEVGVGPSMFTKIEKLVPEIEGKLTSETVIVWVPGE